ncbi:MAG TPA: hypothetical protein VH253_11035 [Phycisphaerae bacterium]|nr:hypothetical protein [Phycisphaerae bacterium]
MDTGKLRLTWRANATENGNIRSSFSALLSIGSFEKNQRRVMVADRLNPAVGVAMLPHSFPPDPLAELYPMARENLEGLIGDLKARMKTIRDSL